MRRLSAVMLCLSSFAPVLLTGCCFNPGDPFGPQAGSAIYGNVHSGNQPIAGARVYILAASAQGYGKSAISMLNRSSSALEDSTGVYVTTDSQGVFQISGNYECIPGSEFYILTKGGSVAGGTNNSASSLMAAIGDCTTAESLIEKVGLVSVNEVSTVAAAYTLAGFAIDSTHVASSGTTMAKRGLDNAFGNSTNLVDLGSGAALATTPSGTGAVPQATINTLANLLAACVAGGSSSSAHCTTLFDNALAGGTSGAVPTDTATAVINIAHHPAANVQTLYNLAATTPSYTPALTAAPANFTVSLVFSSGGFNGPGPVAVDSEGGVWIANYFTNTATKLNAMGVPAQNVPFADPSFNGPYGVALDTSDNAWIINVLGNSVTELSSTGSPVAGSPFTAGGLNGPAAIAIDGSNSVWIVNDNTNTVSKFSHSGVPAAGSPFTQPGLVNPYGIAIDAKGNAWVADYTSNNVAKFTSTGATAPGSPYGGAGLLECSAVAISNAGDAWIANYNAPTATELLSSGAAAPGTPVDGGGLSTAQNVIVDGDGNAWFANYNSFSEISSTGVVLSPSTGYTGTTIQSLVGIAIDGAGNVWAPSFQQNAVVEVIGVAAPVITPLSKAVAMNMIGVRP